MEIKFGTDGWRAVIAQDFTYENLAIVVQAHADRLKKLHAKKVVVGYDFRFMSEDFSRLAAEIMASNGLDVTLSSKACSTSALSLVTKDFGADEGVMITASHNLYKYNGYKIKGSYGSSATPEIVGDIETYIGKNKIATGNIKWEESDFNHYYTEKLKTFITPGIFLQKEKKVVHDCMHGSAMGLLKNCLESTKMEVLEINDFRDPMFGNHHPEPIDENLSLLKIKTQGEDAIAGIANDGDGDRFGLVDEKGDFVNAQLVYVLLLLHTLRYRKVPGAVVKTVSTSYLVDRICKKENRQLFVTPVGFKNIVHIFQKEKVAFGGEESGGYAFGFHIPERDGILSALMMLETVITQGKTITELMADIFSEFGRAYYDRVDVKVKENQAGDLVNKMKKSPPKEFAGKNVREYDMQDGMKLIFEDDSWILFRASGTEPILRMYAEAPDKKEVQGLLYKAQSLIKI